MKFLQYRENWASGNGKWEYKLIGYEDEIDKEWIEEMIEEIHSHHNWSDKYRGIDYEIVDYPGHEWMKRHIRMAKQRIENAEKLLGNYNALYYKNGGT